MHRGIDIAPVERLGVDGIRHPHPVMERVEGWQRGIICPCHPKGFGGADRDLFPLGHDAEEVAVANDRDHAEHCQCIAVVDRNNMSRPVHGANVRANDAPVEHPVQDDIVNVGATAGQLREEIDARHRCPDNARRALTRSSGVRNGAGERLPGQIADRDGEGRAVDRPDHAIDDG